MKKILILIIFILVCVLCFILFSYKKKITFAVPPFDENVTSIPEKIDNEYYAKLDVSDGFSFGLSGVLIINNKKEAYVNFTSSENNNVYIRLRLINDNNNVIGESGLIKSNQYLEKIKLKNNFNEKDKFTLKVMAYDPKTYYSMSAVNLSVSLKVIENE